MSVYIQKVNIQQNEQNVKNSHAPIKNKTKYIYYLRFLFIWYDHQCHFAKYGLNI